MFNNGGITPVMNVDGNRDNGWGMDGGIWAWFLLAIFFGWGGNGFGFGGGNGTQAGFTDAAVQRGFDQQSIISKLDGLTNGLCDSTYALNNSIQQGNFGLQTAIMQGFNASQAQASECCCQTQRAIDQVRFDNAQNTCAITTAIAQGFAQTDRTINDKFCELEMNNMRRELATKDSIIASQTAQISNDAQTRELINTLRPCPEPAYITCNPWASNYAAQPQPEL